MKSDDRARKLIRWMVDILATILIFGAIFVMLWLARPYIALFYDAPAPPAPVTGANKYAIVAMAFFALCLGGLLITSRRPAIS